MARSLNKVQLIGNVTRDPELRYTPSGAAVCSFGVATNRGWTTDTGEKHEETEFHRIVAWNKLAELCSQFLVKGRKVYVQGRLSTRNWTGQDGQQRSTTEVVIDDMILLDNKGAGERTASTSTSNVAEAEESEPVKETHSASSASNAATAGQAKKKPAKAAADENMPAEMMDEDQVAPDDIPF